MGFLEFAVLGGMGLFFKKMLDSANESAEERKRAQGEEEKRKKTK